MINIEKAKTIAINYLNEKYKNLKPKYKGICIKNSLTIEKNYGWIFFYNTNAFYETSNLLQLF